MTQSSLYNIYYWYDTEQVYITYTIGTTQNSLYNIYYWYDTEQFV